MIVGDHNLRPGSGNLPEPGSDRLAGMSPDATSGWLATERSVVNEHMLECARYFVAAMRDQGVRLDDALIDQFRETAGSAARHPATQGRMLSAEEIAERTAVATASGRS